MDRSPNPTSTALATAVEHHQAGRLAAAEMIYRQVLSVQPKDPDALHLLGVVFAQQGKHAEAVQSICRAIVLRPTQAEMHINLASALSNSGQHERAVEAYQHGIKLQPNNPNALADLASELAILNRHEEAVAAYGQVVALRPGNAAAYNNLGSALMTAGRMEESKTVLEQALRLDPACGSALTNLGLQLARQKRYDEAIATHQQAIAAQPNLFSAHINLADALNAVGRSEEAMAVSTRALQLDPKSAKACNNLACSLRDLGRPAEAETMFVKSINLQPQPPEPHYNLALTLLGRGEFALGWEQYEWRSVAFPGAAPPIHRRWQGEPLEGRTLLIHAEQGLGDTLQFARYLPLARQRAGPGQIVFQCQPELARLLRQSYPNEQVVPTGEPLPPVHFQCLLLSLPRLLGTRLENVPADIPYLHASPADSATWRDRLGAGEKRRRVGLVWAGNPDHPNNRTRSPSPADWTPLAGATSVQWVCLQKHKASAPPLACPPGLELLDLTPNLHDFGDTAALLSQLDLVITVDTAVAHLAGAMGKPVWILLPFAADWRWLQSREDSPWYPTARLFRQTKLGDWNGVVARVAEALRQLSPVATSLRPENQTLPST